MADLIRNPPSGKCHRTGGMLLALLVAQAAAAAPAPAPSILEDGLTWSADVLTSDFRSDTLDLSGNVRVTQGVRSIEAGAAKASNMRSDPSRWTFEKAVIIRSEEAELQSNLATAAVVNGELADARVEGTPARFEQRRAGSDRQIRGRAGLIEYDFVTGIVKLTNQVWFSNGKDEFRGDVVIYSIRDERVQINPGGSSNRVRGIIRPSTTKTGGKPPRGATGAANVEPQVDDDGEFDEQAEQRLATDGGGA